METLPYEPINLIACDAQLNFWRRYRIAACRDLFGHILIETQWGRIGARGRYLIRSFSHESDALKYVRIVLARRATAPLRIGIAYRYAMPDDKAPWSPSHKSVALADSDACTSHRRIDN